MWEQQVGERIGRIRRERNLSRAEFGKLTGLSEHYIGRIERGNHSITGAAIALGIAAGEISSRLFVPIIQHAYTASEKVIPFMVITETDDYLRLVFITGLMIVICMGILGVLVSRIKITQALKLGED